METINGGERNVKLQPALFIHLLMAKRANKVFNLFIRKTFCHTTSLNNVF